MSEANPKHLPPDALEDWVKKASELLDVNESIDIGAVLDLTRDVAHGVARPAAPLTTFLLGLALGRLPREEYESRFSELHLELTRLSSEQQGL